MTMEQVQTIVNDVAKAGKKAAKVGRPRAITRNKVEKLMHILEMGDTIDNACNFAGIDKKTYYNESKRNEGFSTKMAIARNRAKGKALKNVGYYLDKGDLETSKWWLEHKHSDEFSKRPDVAVQVNNFTVDFIDDDGETIDMI
jgi:hypothetical protein